MYRCPWPLLDSIPADVYSTCYCNNGHTVDGERFAGLNIRGFSAIEVITEILSRCLGYKCSLFSTVKERCLNSRKNFCDTPENRESLAQRIFPCLRYVDAIYEWLFV